MFRKKDILIISAALCIALVAYGVTWIARSGQKLSSMVEIRAGNALYQTVPLGPARQIEVRQDNGDWNVIEIDWNGIRMVESSCKNQLCVQQGAVTVDNWRYRSLGRSIICLPNRVIVELTVENAQQIQLEQDLADV